jgi:excisionase family DNA binding protein
MPSQNLDGRHIVKETLKVGKMADKRLNEPDLESTLPLVLTVAEVSDYLRVHPTTVYRLLRKKQLPAFRVGSEWRFSQEAIDRWRSEEEQALVSAKPRRKREK